MKRIMKGILIIVLVTVYSCTGEDPLSPLASLFLPNFSNGWQVEKGSDGGLVFFISRVTDSTKAKGTLEGSDQKAGRFAYAMVGTFESTSVDLTYKTNAQNGGADNGPLAGKTFRGIFDKDAKPARLRLKNIAGSDSLVLRQG